MVTIPAHSHGSLSYTANWTQTRTYYVDKNDTDTFHDNCTPVRTGTDSYGSASNDEGWYYVSGKQSIPGITFCDRSVNLILCDDAEVTITSGASKGVLYVPNGTLTVYAQRGGGGRLTVRNTLNCGIAANNGVALYGGTITAYGQSAGIGASGPIDIRGGWVAAACSSPTGDSIAGSSQTVTLGCSGPDDFITVSNINCEMLQVADGQVLGDGDEYYKDVIQRSLGAGETTFRPAYKVNVADGIEHGTVDTNPTYAIRGQAVALTVIPETGYALDTLTVTDASGNDVAVTEEEGALTFTMPAGGATVSGTFVTKWSHLQNLLRAGGTVTLDTDYTDALNEGPLTVPGSVNTVLDLNGHVIDRHLTEEAGDGGVITVEGTLTVTDSASSAAHENTALPKGGVITGGWKEDYGGGVFCNGALTLEGGTIYGNRATNNGGGVCVNSGNTCAFTMTGGAIKGNTADRDGGGVLISQRSGEADTSPSFKLSGGEISGNSATRGGGVYAGRNRIFAMTGGAIRDNTAETGGGVYVDGAFGLSRGAVTGNQRADDSADDVFLPRGNKIDVAGLTAANVGVRMSVPGAFTTGGSFAGDVAARAVFTSNLAVYEIGADENGQAKLRPLPATPPTIGHHTVEVYMTYGQTGFVLSVEATAAEGHALSYQWYRDGAAIDGATEKRYAIPADQDAGSYTYYCAVTATRADNGEAATVNVENATVTISPREIAIPTAVQNLRWTGREQTGVRGGEGYTVENGTGTAVGDYTATASLLNANYKWSDGTTADKEITWSIGKAAPVIADVKVNLLQSVQDVSVSVAGKMPADAGNPTYETGTSIKPEGVTVGNFTAYGGTVTATITGGAEGDTVTLPVIVSSCNYEDTTINVVVTITNVADADVTITGDRAKTYGDDPFTLTSRRHRDRRGRSDRRARRQG